MSILYFVVPSILLAVSVWLANKSVQRGFSKKKAVVLQISLAVSIMAIYLFTPIVSAHAGGAMESVAAADVAANANAFGIGLIAAALVTGLSGIGGGIAVASAAPAAIAATSEDPKAFGKALIFVALGEGIAIFGLVVSIMIFGKLDALVLGA